MLLLKTLVERRFCKLQEVYIFPAIFLFLVGLIGFVYGAPLLYWPLAFICLSLAFYPTLLAWGIVAIAFLSGAGIYIHAMIQDIIVPSSSGIYSDGLLGPIFAFIVIAMAFFIVVSFPKKLKQESETDSLRF